MTSTYFSIKLRCFILFQLPTMLASLVRHIPSTLFSFPSTANYVSSIQPCCYFLYQRPATLASLVGHCPTTLLSSPSTSNYVIISGPPSCHYVVIFSINFQLRFWCLWVAKPWHRCDQTLAQKKNAFMCQNHGPTVTLRNGPPKIEYFSGDEMSIFDGQRTEKQWNQWNWDANLTKNHEIHCKTPNDNGPTHIKRATPPRSITHPAGWFFYKQNSIYKGFSVAMFDYRRVNHVHPFWSPLWQAKLTMENCHVVRWFTVPIIMKKVDFPSRKLFTRGSPLYSHHHFYHQPSSTLLWVSNHHQPLDIINY